MSVIAVSGHSGQIGSRVLRALKTKTYTIVPIDRQNLWSDDLSEWLRRSEVEGVIHMAGGGVNPWQRDPIDLWTSNVKLTGHLTQACVSAGVKSIVSLGSGSEYAPCSEPIRESAPLNMTHPYGLTKAAAGLSGLALCEGSPTTFSHLRLFGMYGAEEKPHRLLPTLVRAWRSGQAAKLSGGNQVRDWLSADDVARAILAAIDSAILGKLNSGIYNLGSSIPISVREFVQQTLDLLECSIELADFGAISMRSGEASILVADTSKFSNSTGWQPYHSLESGLQFEIDQMRRSISWEEFEHGAIH